MIGLLLRLWRWRERGKWPFRGRRTNTKRVEMGRVRGGLMYLLAIENDDADKMCVVHHLTRKLANTSGILGAVVHPL